MSQAKKSYLLFRHTDDKKPAPIEYLKQRSAQDPCSFFENIEKLEKDLVMQTFKGYRYVFEFNIGLSDLKLIVKNMQELYVEFWDNHNRYYNEMIKHIVKYRVYSGDMKAESEHDFSLDELDNFVVKGFKKLLRPG